VLHGTRYASRGIIALHEVPHALRGRQTVGSPRCRARRWRQDSRRQQEAVRARDVEIRARFVAALWLLDTRYRRNEGNR
jgi:hypothetical protein